MKRVLIITYYWPPVGGAGVQRWLKHTKYLREFGWEPIIYTPENPDLSIEDPSLGKDIPEGLEIIKTKVWEPYGLFRKISGKQKNDAINHGMMSERQTPGFMERAGVWVRGNFFIPDARMFWIKPSVSYLTKYLQQHQVDVIISTGPPHSMHQIARQVHEQTKIPWVADFRDPWTNNDVYNRLPLTSWADKKHRRLELEILQQATAVVTVSNHWASDFEKLSGRKADVITNGFDMDDFKAKSQSQMQGFVIHHIGSMYADRNPVTLWKVLAELRNESEHWRSHLRVRLTGKTDQAVLRSARAFGLDDCLDVQDYIPHDEVIAQMKASPVLLLMLNDAPDVMGRIPGKLFEYLACRRPIVGIGATQGDSAAILQSTGAGEVVGFDDAARLRTFLEQLFTDFQAGKLSVPEHSIEQYTRKYLAGRYAALLNTLGHSDTE